MGNRLITLTVGVVLSASLLLGGCGGSSENSGSSSEAAESSPPAGGSDSSPSEVASPADASTASTSGDTTASGSSAAPGTALDGSVIDCAATKKGLEELNAHISVLATLAAPREGDTVAGWKTMSVIVDPARMSDTVSILRGSISAYDSGAPTSFNAFEDGAAILDRGLAGDETAQADMKTWGGKHLPNLTSLMLPLNLAYEASGCRA